MGIVAVCGSYHKAEIELMLDYAREEAAMHSLDISEIVWGTWFNGSAPSTKTSTNTEF
mgnify:CR=1 FL=1